MNLYFAHDGINHSQQPTSIVNLIKTDGPKVLIISLVAIAVMIIAIKLMDARPAKSKVKKDEE